MFPAERNPRTERVQFELRATGVNLEETNKLRSGIHSRGYLPHVKRENARYFVTFRLADSLPKEVVLKIQAERAERLNRLQPQVKTGKTTRSVPVAADSLEKIERDHHRAMERFLDKGIGECWLRRREIADLVRDAFHHFEGERYLLNAWVVMPNHVHAVVWPMPNHVLSDILRDLKSFTAREANKLLGRSGKNFWQRESFDHWIRNEVEHERCCRYVANNPVKAGLCEAVGDWRWSSAWRSAPLP